MRRPSPRFAATSLLALGLAAAPAVQAAKPPHLQHHVPIARPKPAPVVESAPLAPLVSSVDIPYEMFRLANGLTVIVHTDRKAPIIGVTTYYRVGSKNEPRGRTGFAHLYEHLFFGGTENAPSFDVPLEASGVTQLNGSTYYDRTNYVETVPKGALGLALFLESDRMGHLLGAVTQDKLDKQRGVVENEKRQNDNQPYGLVQYAMGEGLFPVGHPYRHQTIGSMADIDAATLGDVRGWFRDHYGPNNAVLVLTGDIDAATARPLVEKYYADIPGGPAVQPVSAAPVTLPAPLKREMSDQVATLRLHRAWSGPSLNDPDTPALEMAMKVLGGLASSRLDNTLVRGKQLAVSVSAGDETLEQVSFLTAQMDVKPGVDRKLAEAAFDSELAHFIKDGPSADELKRAITSTVSEEMGSLEVVGGFGGKGATLAEGQLYSANPAQYKEELARIAALTPEQVRAAAAKWLTRPVFSLGVTPGERTESGDTMGGWGDEASTPVPPRDAKAPVPPVPTSPPRAAPPVAPIGEIPFPTLERTRLSNGVVVTLARRTAVPKVMVSIAFDAGIAADAQGQPGTQGMLMAMLKEGTAGPSGQRDATALLEAEERLGAKIETGASLDTSSVTLDALTANLAPSLALMTDLVRHPALAPGDVERVRARRQAELAEAQTTPQARAVRALAPLLFGPTHPYGQPGDGLGTAKGLAALTPETLRAAQGKWLRPDLARITVVGDIDMAHLKPLLEEAFGTWQAPATPAPTKPIDTASPAPTPRVILIDRPGAPQSVIVGGRVLAITGRAPGQEALDAANEVLGTGLLSRLNADLREDKGWSYGVQTVVRQPVGPRSLIVFAPVETPRTGDSLKGLIADMKAYPATSPLTDVELQRVTEGHIRSLASKFETNGEVLSAIVTSDRLGRPDDYYATLPARYRALDKAAIEAAARASLQPDALTYVIVGDAKAVLPQLKDSGLKVELAPGK